jgi:hypothetical protein
MTAARQQRKSRLVLAALALGAGILLPVTSPVGARAAMVINSQSGLAISGFDPVAYFTDGQPRVGRPDLELTQGGAVWRFRNEGNRAAFADHPEVYTPRFGGYDPVAAARGASVPGHPLFWVVIGERLYLFYDAKARAAFMAQPGRIIDAAERKWPAVAHALAR